jgi:hypothetical protein
MIHRSLMNYSTNKIYSALKLSSKAVVYSERRLFTGLAMPIPIKRVFFLEERWMEDELMLKY